MNERRLFTLYCGEYAPASARWQAAWEPLDEGEDVYPVGAGRTEDEAIVDLAQQYDLSEPEYAASVAEANSCFDPADADSSAAVSREGGD